MNQIIDVIECGNDDDEGWLGVNEGWLDTSDFRFDPGML